VALVLLAAAGSRTAAAQAAGTCTWGGTPDAQTGVNKIDGGGLTATPSTTRLHFHATGPLGGQCSGTLTFDGTMDAGASCGYISFHARAWGIPGVTSVEGTAASGFSPARLYDRNGNLVGSENAQFLGDPSIASKCASPGGVTENPFSSVIELAGGGSKLCSWGGTPAAPSGVITFDPGVTNTPSLGTTQFTASGPLSGPGCTGKLTFKGTIDPGETCGVSMPFHATASGLPPVARAEAATGIGGTQPVVLYDRDGNAVGSEQAQFLSGATDKSDPAFLDCTTPQGVTRAIWSDTVELFNQTG
jgi:hypothetical protein